MRVAGRGARWVVLVLVLVGRGVWRLLLVRVVRASRGFRVGLWR